MITGVRPLLGRILEFCLLVFAAGLLAGSPVVAAGPVGQDGSQATENRAALVVRFDENRIETFCVSFSEPVIYGDEMLELAGLRPDIAGDGRICSVDSAGCSSQDCWCRCSDFNDCTYWAYYHLEDGAWVYSTQGATTSTVSPGDVEAWSWGKGNFVSGVEPPPHTFEEICGVSGPAGQDMPAANSTATTPRSALGVGGRAMPTPILLARSSGARSQQPSGGDAKAQAASPDRSGRAAGERSFQASLLPQYAAYLLMAAFLGVLAAWVLHRRAGRAETPAGRDPE